MRSIVLALSLAGSLGVAAVRPVDYTALWDGAKRFDQFLSSVKSREAQWKSRFANAAIDADVLSRTRALNEKRRLLVIAEDRCHDSAWAVPYIAKLAAAAPERLELRVTGREAFTEIRDYRTPDGRLATPTVIVLNESNEPLAGWVERPAALHAWVKEKRGSMSSAELQAEQEKWYSEDAGRSTIREIVALLEKTVEERK
jgi:hypothetical protein